VRRFALVLACTSVLAFAAAAGAATTPTAPVFNGRGRLVQTPLVPTPAPAHLTKARALAIFRRDPKIAAWLRRYPAKGQSDEETYDAKAASWTVKLWWGAAGEIAEGTVDDASGVVVEAWTGPQVAWKMARGYKGAFGGVKINSPWV